MTQTLDSLNNQFAIAKALRFVDASHGLPVVEINTQLASARVALQGAHVLTWQPTGQAPVLWVSRAAVFEPGKPVRGGVPVCWPWFGAREGQSTHGFVRTRLWQMREASMDAAGQVALRLGISDDAATRAIWDFAFDLELLVTVGQTLSMALTTRNTGAVPFTVTQALHTYFCTTDIAETSVTGFDGCAYLDKVQNQARGQQSGVVRFEGETDRVYLDTQSDCLIEDGRGGRTIRITKTGSASTVVWNPWQAKEKTFADMAQGEYQQMLCVETCNAGPDQITLAPGSQHTLSARVSLVV